MKIEGRLAALGRELQELRAMLDMLVPPARPAFILTSAEAGAVGKFLLATTRGEAVAFERECPASWRRVQDVAHRQPSEGRARYDAQATVPRVGHAAA